jgi:hypothetical protein
MAVAGLTSRRLICLITTFRSVTAWRSPTFAATVTVPGETEDTTPSWETMATDSFEEDQTGLMSKGLSMESFSVSSRFRRVPTGPMSVAWTGETDRTFMSTTSTGICVESLPYVAVTTVLPSFLATRRPDASTVTMSGLADDQTIGPISIG